MRRVPEHEGANQTAKMNGKPVSISLSAEIELMIECAALADDLVADEKLV
jgi:hypothetical protein